MTEEQNGKWSSRSLGEICRGGGGSVQTGPFGSQLHAEDYVDDGIPIITVEHLSDGAIAHDNLPLVGEPDYRRLRRYRLKGGDLVFSRVGAIDRCAFVSDSEDGWLFSGRCLRVRTGNGQTDPRYLAYVLNSWPSRQWILNHAVGSTMACLNTSILSAVPLTMAPPEEQPKIAEILSTVDRAIEQTEALIAKQQRIKTGLMQDLLTRGIDEHGNLRSEQTHEFKDSPLGRIPVEWEVTLLDALAVRGSGHTPNKQRPAYWNGGIKWVSLADSRRLDDLYISRTDKEISDLGLKHSSAVLHPAGTVILSRDAGVGKSAILAHEMAVSQHFMAWRCKTRKLDNVYLYYWLQRDKPKFEGVASGSTIVTIGLQFFRDYSIAAPREVDEQIAISTKLERADSAITQTTIHSRKLRRLKTALMQALLTGNRRVTALLEPDAVTA